jgi:CRP/FNR family cyclic AMP-dependent transcriptional regulator
MAASACHVLREDPALAEGVSPERRERAEETCIARTLKVRRGRWSSGSRRDQTLGGSGLLILEGLLLRRVDVGGRCGAELLGRGDLLRPDPVDDAETVPARATTWRALELTRLAVLDDRAVECMAPYPGVIGRLIDRAVERSRRLAVNMAVVHHPRVGVRLQMLFWHLADRWGRVCNDRMLVPVRLTYTVLADLVAAQRPTISTTLSGLERRQILRPISQGWLLLDRPTRGSPPSYDRGCRSPPLATTRPEAWNRLELDSARPSAGSSCVRPIARVASPRLG